MSLADAVQWTQDYIDGLQSTNSIQYYFADLFDIKTASLYRIFSKAAKAAYGITDAYFILSMSSDLLKQLDNRLKSLEATLYHKDDNTTSISNSNLTNNYINQSNIAINATGSEVIEIPEVGHG